MATKHSYWSIRNNPHFLDWANRPLPFKIYPKIEPFPLPREVPQTGVAALSAISGPVPSSRGDSIPGLGALTSFTALESGGKASVVISLISRYPLVTVAFAVTILHERLTLAQAIGVGLAIVAAILLSLEPKAPDAKV